jgi:electron transfer flavoprotein alpha subunit
MTTLVIAEHDNTSIKTATLNTLAAAAQVGGEVHVLVAGSNARGVANTAAKIAGVSKVLLADAPQLADGLAENIDSVVLSIAKNYSHIFAPATVYGKRSIRSKSSRSAQRASIRSREKGATHRSRRSMLPQMRASRRSSAARLRSSTVRN